MPSPRSLPYSITLTQGDKVSWGWFVAITLPTGTNGPTGVAGVQRFTDYDISAATSISLNIDGTGAQSWYTDSGAANGGAFDLQVGTISQGEQSAGAVALVTFANLSALFHVTMNTVFGDSTVGWSGRSIVIWKAQFDPDTGALSGATKFFDGKIDNHTIGDRATFTLDPRRTPFRQAPSLTAVQLGAAAFLPDKEKTIHWNE